MLRSTAKALGGFSAQLGFRPDFEMQEMLPGGYEGRAARVNMLFTVLRLRNGAARDLKQ